MPAVTDNVPRICVSLAGRLRALDTEVAPGISVLLRNVHLIVLLDQLGSNRCAEADRVLSSVSSLETYGEAILTEIYLRSSTLTHLRCGWWHQSKLQQICLVRLGRDNTRSVAAVRPLDIGCALRRALSRTIIKDHTAAFA